MSRSLKLGLLFCLSFPVLGMPQTEPTTERLNILYRLVRNLSKSERFVNAGLGDFMTTTNPAECPTCISDGQIFYIPSDSTPGTGQLERWYNGSDTMDFPHDYPGFPEGEGYAPETILGHPWATSSATPGLSQIYGAVSSAPFDRGTGYFEEIVPPYSIEFPWLGYGYRRYNNANTSLLTLSAGGITIKSNAVAGGALWELWWNNKNFVNIYDYGRQIQAALFWHLTDSNPTEAGHRFSGPEFSPSSRGGSPLLSLVNNGETQISRSIPLQWDPTRAGFEGDALHPLVWKDIVLGKDITLNFNGMGSVAKYTTYMSIAPGYEIPVPPIAGLQMPAIFLTHDLNVYAAYYADTNPPTVEILSETYDDCNSLPSCTSSPPPCDPADDVMPMHGGVIASTPDGTYAIGVYGVNTEAGGSITLFSTENGYVCPPSNDNSPTSFQTSAISPWHDFFESISAGTYTFNSYIITGTASEVIDKMQELYKMGVQ